MSFGSMVKGLASSQVRFVRRTGTVGEWVLAASPSLFTITGGAIRVVVFYGKVTAVFDATATTLQPRITPVAGAAAIQVLSNASGSLANAAINTTIVPTGVIAGACTVEITFGVTVGNMVTNQWVLLPGVIDALVGTGTNLTGAMDFCMGYIPLEPGSNVAPA